jgi:ribosomal protein S18 acetylase RimI-like enzyme
MTAELRLRPVTDADEGFLRTVYASTRTEELAPLGWPPEAVAAFCDQQAEAQHRHYRSHYPDASYDVVLVGGTPAGRLYVDRSPAELRIVDIALLPEFRGDGVGSRLLAGLLAESDRTGVPVRIHVEQHNPALHWYERHGFRPIADRGVYWFLERLPHGAAPSDRLLDGAEEGVRA